MLRIMKTVALLSGVFWLSACATIIRGGHDTLTVNSLEKGSVIYVDGVPRGKEHAQLEVERGNTHTILVKKEGCQDVTAQTGESFDAVSLLGVFIDFGIISIPVDLISGSAWKTKPKTYTVTPIC